MLVNCVSESPQSFDHDLKQLVRWVFLKYYTFHFNFMCYISPYTWVNCNTTKGQL